MLESVEPHVELQAVVWERQSWRRTARLWMRRIRRRGWWYPIDRLALAAYCRLRLTKSARQCVEVTQISNASKFEPNCPTHAVQSVNDLTVRDCLKETQPDLVLVWGTSIIGRRALRTGGRFVNVHTGVTPRYRGAHGGVWAVIEEDYENIGVTVHEVDEGIDTGQILRQGCIQFDPKSDNLVTIAAKQQVLGIAELVDWLKTLPDNEKHRLAASVTESGRLYYSPGLSDYRRFEANARRLAG